MAERQASPRVIARYLFEDHLALVALFMAAAAVVTCVVTTAIGVFGTVDSSVWDGATNVVRWFAFGYGAHLTYRLLPTCVGHGRTRREFVGAATSFLAVAAGVVALLVAAGFALEGVVYGALDWPHGFHERRPYDSAGDVGGIVVTIWVLMFGWAVVGMLLGVAFTPPGEWAIPAVLLAVAVVIGIDVGAGGAWLPFVGDWADRLDLARPAGVAFAIACSAVAVGATWAIARNVAVRTSRT